VDDPVTRASHSKNGTATRVSPSRVLDFFPAPRRPIGCGSGILRFGGKCHGPCFVPTSPSVYLFVFFLWKCHRSNMSGDFPSPPLYLLFVYSEATGCEFASRVTSGPFHLWVNICCTSYFSCRLAHFTCQCGSGGCGHAKSIRLSCVVRKIYRLT